MHQGGKTRTCNILLNSKGGGVTPARKGADMTKEELEGLGCIDEGIKKFIEINGNIDEALAYLMGAIKKSKGTIVEHALIYAYGKLLQYKD